MNEILRLNGGEIGPLLRILAGPSPLPEDIRSAFEGLTPQICKLVTGETVFRSGDELTRSYAVNAGWVGRVHTTEEGRTQIVNLYLPGDMFIVHHGARYVATLDAVALTDAEIAVFEPSDVLSAAAASHTFEAALHWHAARNMNIVSQQALNVSVRSSSIRVMHQLLEIWRRLSLVGKADSRGFRFPLTQSQLGELCGLSTVSVNRSLRDLRENGLIVTDGKDIRFPDRDRAFDHAGFDPSYLQPFIPLGKVSTASASVPDRRAP